MAAPDPMDKVKDKEYSNWLKVTLALYYMKSGLHTFIQCEVDHLHQYLVQKIYGGQTVPLPPCTTCHSSLVRRNKHTGVWEFKKQCKSYCHVWCHELLVLHTNPKSEKIYWDNSHVPSWPFKPWECVKVFMPRGQLPSNAGPAECDAQALLTLVANCAHFHRKLSSQGLQLIHTISLIRNKVMHDGEMKLSDADIMSFIQQIIQLLEDPVSLMLLEDCKAAVDNIHKIHNDSIDVVFNMDLQMIALKTAVNEVRQELGMQEKRTLDTVESLKEEYRQLREQLTTEVKHVETRVDTIERDVQLVKEQTDISLQKLEKKHQEMHATVTSQLTKRYEDVENRMDMVVQDVQSVKEQTDTALQQQESLSDSMETMSTSVATHGLRLDTVEENVQSLGTKLQEFETVKEQTDTALQQQKTFSDSMETISTGVATHGVRLDTVEEIVQSFGTKLQEFETVKEKTDTALQQQKMFSEYMETMSASVATCGVRLDAVEENLIKLQEIGQRTEESSSCTKETPTKRRPQSDRLRELKSRTEDELDTVRMLGFSPTKQMGEAKKLLQDKRSIVIQGNPGEGKTTTAHLLINDENFIDRRVLISSPRDWKTIDTDWVDIVVLEDIFGKFDLDPSSLQKWLVYLPSIQQHVDAGKLQVIITTRVDILAKAYTHLGSINLFCDEFSLTLSSDKLQESEKMKILNKELQRHKRDMQDDDKKECIANFKGLIGFPQCCSFFAADNGLFAKGPDFFKQPEKLFSVNIRELEDSSFLSLAFLFCINGIDEKYLSTEALTEWGKSVLIELSSDLGISKKKAAVRLLRESYDKFSGLYVRKCNSSISFSHNTVWEVVGLVLGERSPEMVIKYCDSEFLNQRTYAAESKDKTSHNVFIPVSAYHHLAKRIILDAVEGRIECSRLDTHSALKQHQFVIELKDQLGKCDRIDDFLFSAKHMFFCAQNVAKGECRTFLQFLLQSDGNTAKAVYDQLLEFLICRHDIGRYDTKCSKCSEKKRLLELAIYYNHLDIADKLITMNVCISPISLYNAIKHGNLERVKTIIEHLKRDGSLNPLNKYMRKSLCRAFKSGNPNLVELFLKESIKLDSNHIKCVVKNSDIDALVKLVEHLKHGNDWDPLHEKGSQKDLWTRGQNFCNISHSLQKELPFSRALFYAYRDEKLDMAGFLLKEGVKVTMDIFLAVLKDGSYTAATEVLRDLKDTNQWNRESDCVSEAVETAYRKYNCDLFELLIQKEVSFSIKNLPDVVSWGSSESVTEVVQDLKHGFRWDPNSDYASQALKNALFKEMSDVCVLLVREGVPFTLDIITDIKCWGRIEFFTKIIEHLRERNKWDPKSDIASKILEMSYIREKNDVSKQLLREGVTLTMSNLPDILYFGSRDSIIKAIHHLKERGKWDATVFRLSEPLCSLLCERNRLIMNRMNKGLLQTEMNKVKCSDFVLKAIQHLKDSGNWDPECDSTECDSTNEAIIQACKTQMHYVCDILMQEGVLIEMNDLYYVLRCGLNDLFPKAIKHYKDTDKWYGDRYFAPMVLIEAYLTQQYDVCDLLVNEGFLLSMKDLSVLCSGNSVESVKRAIRHLQDNNNWHPKCEHISIELEKAFTCEKYSLCDLLIQEGVSLSMKNLPGLMHKLTVSSIGLFISLPASFESVTKAIQHLKNTNSWDSNSYHAFEALQIACVNHMYDVCNMLFQEGVSFTMNNLIDVVSGRSWMTEEHLKETEFITQIIKYLKDTDMWDPLSAFATQALAKAFSLAKYPVINLLLQQENIVPTMNMLPGVVGVCSNEWVTKLVQPMKINNTWDPTSELASDALHLAFIKQDFYICNFLIHEKVLLRMKNLPNVVRYGSIESITKAIQLLKDENLWESSSQYASMALGEAYEKLYSDGKHKSDLLDILFQEGVPLEMKDLARYLRSYQSFTKVIHHLKDRGNWDPHSESASVALQHAYKRELYGVCDLLIQEGVSPTMENLPIVINFSRRQSLTSVSKVVQQLKDKGNWNPHSESASVALQQAYVKHEDDVCDLLIQEGISPTMEILLHVINASWPQLKYVLKLVQQLKDKGNWNPNCESASVALQQAYVKQEDDVCDLLIQEGMSPTMEILLHVINASWPQLKYVLKLVQQLKDKGNWNPNCESASVALQQAYVKKMYGVCYLLIQEGVSPTMENLPIVIHFSQRQSVTSVSKVVQQLKDKGNWNPTCESASVALQQAYEKEMYDVSDLLIQEGVSPTMENLPIVIHFSQRQSVTSVSKVVQQLKDKGNWNPTCESASVALQQAYEKEMYDVSDLLIQEGISPTMENLLLVINVFWPSLKSVSKVVQHLKDKGNWNPHSESASVALQQAYAKKKYICDLHSESVSVALQQACEKEMYDVCDLLIQEGILPMK